MRRWLMMAAAAGALTVGASAGGQAQDMPRMLQGLLTGNQGQDQAVREAYERGYRQGRQDEASLGRRQRPRARGDEEGDQPAPYGQQDRQPGRNYYGR